jgi:hypothetical protein
MSLQIKTEVKSQEEKEEGKGKKRKSLEVVTIFPLNLFPKLRRQD